MDNRTAFFYLLAGRNYYKRITSTNRHEKLKEASRKELKYLSKLKYHKEDEWHPAYLDFLYSVLCVNLLGKYYERRLKHLCRLSDKRFSPFAPATYFALHDYNRNLDIFSYHPNRDDSIENLINTANRRVNTFLKEARFERIPERMIDGLTPIGIELEFSNVGTRAGNFFEQGVYPFRNFSKYHHYHLLKFLWRFGAYIDSNYSMKQYIKKGGFLEYTFIPSGGFTGPLTSSASLAGGLIKESLFFTPVKPHSLHLSLEIDSRTPNIEPKFEDVLLFMMMSGDLRRENGRVVEKRILDGDVKGTAVIRDRINREGLKFTVEFAHLRLSPLRASENYYEPLILLLTALKNIFSFSDVDIYRNHLYDWARNARQPKIYPFPVSGIGGKGPLRRNIPSWRLYQR
ncbi:hypothetical protein [Limisalsivibrio acetivorans]|uniref:hypothetical protein n=1 Tax=Limisalsivibrio acetivorans TaxID=1304888 RepID=UPI0003FF0C32|nr:hypothetical protein [Limisalsivibrio acetivorans]